MKKVLIVDDELLFRNSLVRALHDIRAELKAVATGEEAIVEIDSSFYNLCLLDVRLPGISGIDVMKKINEVSPQTKIAIITACVINEDEMREIERGASLFIEKPINLPQLKAFVKEVLESGESLPERRGFGTGIEFI